MPMSKSEQLLVGLSFLVVSRYIIVYTNIEEYIHFICNALVHCSKFNKGLKINIIKYEQHWALVMDLVQK